MLVVLGLIAVLIYLVITLKYIVIPFLIAILIAALLVPVVNFCVRMKWPRWAAVTVVLAGFLAVVSGLIVVVVTQVRSGRRRRCKFSPRRPTRTCANSCRRLATATQ